MSNEKLDVYVGDEKLEFDDTSSFPKIDLPTDMPVEEQKVKPINIPVQTVESDDNTVTATPSIDSITQMQLDEATTHDGKPEDWNAGVKKDMLLREIEAQKNQMSLAEERRREHDDILKAFQMEQDVEQAEYGDWISSMGDVAAQNNDFFKVGTYLDTQVGFKDDEDWKSKVAVYENAVALTESFGIASAYAKQVSETKSEEQFLAIVKKINEDKETMEAINHNVGSVGKGVSAMAGALTGFDSLLGIGIPLKAMSAGKAALAMEDVYKAEEAIRKIKRTAMFSGIGLSKGASFLKNEIDEDYTMTDVMLDTLFYSLDFTFMAKGLNNLGKQAYDRAASARAHDALSKAVEGKPLQLGYKGSGQLQLEYKPVMEEAITVRSSVAGEAPIVIHPTPVSKLSYSERMLLPNKADEVAAVIKKEEQAILSISIKKLKESAKKHIDDIDVKIKKLTEEMTQQYQKKKVKLNNAEEIRKLELEKKNIQTSVNHVTKAKTTAKKKKMLDGLNKSMPTLFRSADELDIVKETLSPLQDTLEAASKNIDPDLAQEATERILKENGGVKLAVKTGKDGDAVGVVTKEGKFKPLTRNKKLGLLIGIPVILSASANASEGDTIFSGISGVGAVILMFMAGAKGVNIIKEYSHLANPVRAAAGDMMNTVADIASLKSKNGNAINKIHGAIVEMKNKLGESYQVAYNNASDAGKRLAKDIMWDAENTAEIAADAEKHMAHGVNMDAFYETYNAAYDVFKKGYKRNFLDNVDNLLNSNKMRGDFNKQIADAVENPRGKIDPSVKQVADKWKTIVDDIAVRANKAEVEGFTGKAWEAKKIENYLPRIPKYGKIYKMVHLADGLVFNTGNKTYDALRDNFKAMYVAKNGRRPAMGTKAAETVEEYEKRVDEYLNGVMTRIQESNNKNISGTVGDVLGDSVNSSKFRIDLDYSRWKNIPTKIDGKDVDIKLDDMFERDIETLMAGYSNAMEGHIALANKGYKSYTEALNIAGKEVGAANSALTTAVNNIIGRSQYDASSPIAQFMRAMSNFATPIFLTKSAIMQNIEMASFVMKNTKGFKEMIGSYKELAKVLKARGSDDAVTKMWMDITGMGSHTISNRLGGRAIDDSMDFADNFSEGMIGNIGRASVRMKEASLIAYGIAPYTDFFQRMSLPINGDRIARFLHGKERMTKTELETFGLTEKRIELLRKHLILNDKGNLTAESLEKAMKNERVKKELAAVQYNMTQAQMHTPSVGGLPYWFLNSSLGAAVSTLLSFPMSSFGAYSAPLVKGMSRGEVGSYFDTAMWFGATYAAGVVKKEISGKDYTEEEMLAYALMNSPFMGFASITGVIDPASFGAGEEIVHTTEAMIGIAKNAN